MRYAARVAWVGIGIAIVTLVAAGALVASLLGYGGGGSEVTPRGNFSVSEAKAYEGFPVFFAGETANGHDLTAVAREPLGPMRRNQESVSFMYGTCEIPAGTEGGCSLPVSISNEPACSRNLAMYGGFGSPTPHLTRVRGTSAGFFEGGSRLEIQTGTTTIVVFAFSKHKALEVARSLRGVNTAVTERDPLPPPARGALSGGVPCPK